MGIAKQTASATSAIKSKDRHCPQNTGSAAF
jgi:hypothetical protein